MVNDGEQVDEAAEKIITVATIARRKAIQECIAIADGFTYGAGTDEARYVLEIVDRLRALLAAAG